LICPVFIILGFYTRVALVPAMFNMIMAILIGHSGQPFMEREHAFSFLVPFVVIFLTGPGRYSLDSIIRK
jgi:putative oxidoreductase